MAYVVQLDKLMVGDRDSSKWGQFEGARVNCPPGLLPESRECGTDVRQ